MTPAVALPSLPVLLGGAAAVPNVAVCVAALGIIPGNRKPSTGMTWLILVLAVPVVGVVAFLFLGSTPVERKRHQTQVRVDAAIQERTSEVAALTEADPGWPTSSRWRR